MHTFHIPVLGLGYSVDTAIRVAPLGIASVASIVDDELIERMRRHHSLEHGEEYLPIEKKDDDFRSRRITAYLNLMDKIIDSHFERIRSQPFGKANEIARYFELLPDTAPLKAKYLQLANQSDGPNRIQLENELRSQMVKGAIDVNIMSKVDKLNTDVHGVTLPDQFSDASASLRGFANSTLSSGVVLSAGMNPRLYQYLENFEDFYPGSDGQFRKKIILKVSDFRSGLIQAKFLAKKGLWVSEFRIESGLNCGGHAFATEGYLLGPILEEFKTRRAEMLAELFGLYTPALNAKGLTIGAVPEIKITVQGGIGTKHEDRFLLKHYALNGTGWGSPFLLVPEVTNVDEDTLKDLTEANASDYYISNSSPLGVLFNNFRKSSAEKQRLERITRGRPGSPCKKKYLVSNTEFSTTPICTASREYQKMKISQLKSMDLTVDEYTEQVASVTEKLCLCEGLSASALLKNNLLSPRENKAVSICPGPNLAWFSKVYTLEDMVGHIYGKVDLLNTVNRPHMFINELALYLEYYKKNLEDRNLGSDSKKQKYLVRFKNQLLDGISYYKQLIPQMNHESADTEEEMITQLISLEENLLKSRQTTDACPTE